MNKEFCKLTKCRQRYRTDFCQRYHRCWMIEKAIEAKSMKSFCSIYKISQKEIPMLKKFIMFAKLEQYE